jgi:hypothetical protein
MTNVLSKYNFKWIHKKVSNLKLDRENFKHLFYI